MKILSILLNNCRESDRQIGKKIGISGGAVKSRIKKMLELGIITNFTLRIEPPLLGYGVFYIVVTGQEINDILKQIQLIGEPFVIVPCVGGITVCGIVVKGDVQQKIELTKNLMKDVRVLTIFESDYKLNENNLTKTDLRIISELLKNPREKIENIANKTKLSTKTIARAIDKFQKNNFIQFTLVYDPTKLSGFIPYAILISLKNDLKETLKKFEKEFNENFLQIPFIAKNQIALFLYSDDIYKLDETTQKISSMKEVKTTDLFIPKKINFPQKWIQNAIKKSMNFPTLHLVYQAN